MTRINQAIILLNVARDLLAAEAELWRTRDLDPDADDLPDLLDTIEDLGPLLHTLVALDRPETERGVK